VPEFALYEADLSKRYGTTEARVRDLRALWAEGRVTPAPVQERVPIWLGFNGPQGARRAGRLGEHLLSIEPSLLEPYREGLVEGGHDPASARMTGLVQGFVSDDPEGDWPVVKEHLRYQLDSYRRYMVEGTDAKTPRPVDPDVVRAREMGGVLGWFVHTTPEDMATRVREFVGDAPVETVFFFLSIAGMSEPMVAEHLRVLCTRLAPLLASENPA
jgi:alkanesulfonate monooxygenase SsuD/methylene tetrahydromethanopterin reductase-like flavin-dependent oxidoreductase (luciferase family)